MSFQREIAPKFSGWGEEVADVVEVGLFLLLYTTWNFAFGPFLLFMSRSVSVSFLLYIMIPTRYHEFV